MESVLFIILYFSLIVHLVLIAISVWRVWRGESAAASSPGVLAVLVPTNYTTDHVSVGE